MIPSQKSGAASCLFLAALLSVKSKLQDSSLRWMSHPLIYLPGNHIDLCLTGSLGSQTKPLANQRSRMREISMKEGEMKLKEQNARGRVTKQVTCSR
ncbi:uncharacterized protein BDZ83DRAFT_444405 [Colletotrichum acutatum]|uniref:Secreted protein n=1 Tax=Glomerella acutata TaxID=27357 RepID=A0AAD8XFS5_GLOAC|nr:uncharacterized protein BDZ83DRAFT_444405 [Colletotrichum acutatum]KAK1720404.1 hypothetical protein BDZ83DRAFT_444405 [Colletotrichum acutatum]